MKTLGTSEGALSAVAKFVWMPPSSGENRFVEAVDAAKRADAVVMVLGISSKLEGEEMYVTEAGFKGGDRTSIDLPERQQRLLEAVAATGKPIVVVLLSGSALAVNWAADHANAILQAWFPSDEDGTAVADVLFGDYNPTGRLPVTFYKSLDQLPPFKSYAMGGPTGTARASRSTRSASASVTPSSHTRSSSCQRQWPPAPRLS